MTVVDAWPGLQRAAGCGPFFDLVRRNGGGQPADDPDWYPMTDFADHPLGLASRVNAVRESLIERGFGRSGVSAAVVLRVAASVTFLGLAARLLSPALGCVVVAGVVPDLSWQRVYWRPAAVGVLPLAVGPVTGSPLGPAGSGPAGSGLAGSGSAGRGNRLGADDARLVIGSTVAPVLQLGDVVAERFRVPPGIVIGNVASALVGALEIATRTYPTAADAGTRLITCLLAADELAGAGGFVEPTPDDGRSWFRRRSCCLLYRVDGAGLCGDCVLHNHPRTPDFRR